MRIHTDILTHADVVEAVRLAGIETAPNVRTVRLTDAGVRENGSRSRDHAFTLSLVGTSSRLTNGSGRYGTTFPGQHAATWDEWGIVLGELFRRDPNAIAPPAYESGEHFRWSTGARFDTLKPADQCSPLGHKWSRGAQSMTGAYYVNECERKGCDAFQRNARDAESLHAFILGEG